MVGVIIQYDPDFPKGGLRYTFLRTLSGGKSACPLLESHMLTIKGLEKSKDGGIQLNV